MREFALTQYPRAGNVMGYSVRTSNWRYTEWINQENGKIQDAELYQFDGNSLEKENVAPNHKEEVQRFSEMLHNYLKTASKWQGEVVL